MCGTPVGAVPIYTDNFFPDSNFCISSSSPIISAVFLFTRSNFSFGVIGGGI